MPRCVDSRNDDTNEVNASTCIDEPLGEKTGENAVLTHSRVTFTDR